MGVSPETTAEEIKRSFVEAEIGEVEDIKKSSFDETRLPGVTDGIWELRVKFMDEEKPILHIYTEGMRGSFGH